MTQMTDLNRLLIEQIEERAKRLAATSTHNDFDKINRVVSCFSHIKVKVYGECEISVGEFLDQVKNRVLIERLSDYRSMLVGHIVYAAEQSLEASLNG